jgi:hypothetical protein
VRSPGGRFRDESSESGTDPDRDAEFLAYMALCEMVHRKDDPGPPWLDGANPYPIPYPGILGANQYGYFDSPDVELAKAQAAGAAAVTRQVSFVVNLMWQPQIAGTSFPVPLMAAPWGFSDFASLTNGVWTAGGAITQQLAPAWTNSDPTWLGTAQVGNAPVCTAITEQ